MKSARAVAAAGDMDRFELLLDQAGALLVPGLGYHARLEACAGDDDLASDDKCATAGNNGEPFLRPRIDDVSDSRAGVRVVVPIDMSPAAFHKKIRSSALDFADAEEAMQALGEEVHSTLVADAADEAMRLVPRERIVVTLDEAGDRVLVHFDSLPPSSTDDPSSSSLAEHVLCVLARMDGAVPPSKLRSLLSSALGVEVVDMSSASSSSTKDTTTIRAPVGADDAPVSTDDPNEDPLPSVPKQPARPRLPEEDLDGEPEPVDEAQREREREERAGNLPGQPRDSSSIAEGEEDLASNLPSAPVGTRSPTIRQAEDAWYDQLGVNPMILFLLVALVLATAFWFVCIRSASRTSTDSAQGDMDEGDMELGGVAMPPSSARKSSAGGTFSALPTGSGGEDDGGFSSSPVASTPSSAGGGGGFANEKESGSANKFLVATLISIGIPSFGTQKYTNILSENYLSTIEQLKQLDSSDWKRLQFPLVIEEALRKTLAEHTAKEGRFGSPGSASTKQVAKGLDLKTATKKPHVSKDKSKKKGSLSVAALEASPKAMDDDDPFGDVLADLPVEDEEPATVSPPKPKKGSKKKKAKASLLQPPPEDTPSSSIAAAAAASIDTAASTEKSLDDAWLDDF